MLAAFVNAVFCVVTFLNFFFLCLVFFSMNLLVSSEGKESACNAGDPGSIPGSGRSLEKGMATYSSILAWRILWMEESGEL